MTLTSFHLFQAVAVAGKGRTSFVSGQDGVGVIELADGIVTIHLAGEVLGFPLSAGWYRKRVSVAQRLERSLPPGALDSAPDAPRPAEYSMPGATKTKRRRKN